MTEDLKKAIAEYFGYKSYDDMDTSDRAMAEFVAAYYERQLIAQALLTLQNSLET